MLAGERYLAADPTLEDERRHAEALMRGYNAHGDQATLVQLLGAIGPGSFIRPPFFCDYGYNITLGGDVFVNFNCVMLDVVPIILGDRVQVASAVQFLAADHPHDAAERASGIEFGSPITVEDDVWLGGGVILCPGVTVGRGSIVGAGSVVTKDIPASVVAVGNPCRVMRDLT